MRFVVFLITASVVCAQPVVSRVEVLATHATFRVVFETSDLGAPRDSWIEYGTTPQLGYSTPHVRGNVAGNGPTRNVIESGLSPGTTYFFRPVALGPSGTSKWQCTTGGIGWVCDTTSGLGIFATRELPAQHPAPPAPVTPVDTRMPSINGTTFAVAVDDNKQCTDFAQQLQACAAADPSLNHQIVIPAGASCVGSFWLPLKVGSGTCVVRTDTPDAQLPPEGVRIDPTYVPRMASIVAPAVNTGQAYNRAALNTTDCNGPVCTQGWRFVGIQFTTEDLHETKTPSFEIADVSPDGVITTTEPHGLQTHDQLYVSDVEGFDGRGPNGIFRAARLSPTTLSLQYSYEPPTFTCTAPPCYKTGTGRVTRALATPISSVSNTSPVVITTAAPHGLSNYPRFPIASAMNGVLTVNIGRSVPLGGGHTLRIEGSSASEWNGYWLAQEITATSIKLSEGPKTTCASNCGTITVKETLQIGEVQGTTAANGAHSFTVLSPTEIQLDDVAGNGDYVSGGILALDPDLQLTIISLSTAADRVVLDRCYVNGRGFPSRALYGIVLQANNSGIVDSYINNINSWRSFHPTTQYVEAGYAGLFTSAAVAIDISAGNNKKIDNNFLGAAGITVFAAEASGPTPENIQITRNRFFSDTKWMAGHPNSDGRYYLKAHHMEFKWGRRILIDGNTIDGNWMDFTACGPSIALSIRGFLRDNVTSDYTITNNIFRNTSSAIQIVGADSNSDSITLPTARIRISNNLLYDIDNRAWLSKPSLVGGSGICGYAVSTLWSVEDLTITNNTAVDIRGLQPQFFNYAFGRSEGVMVQNNVFTHNHDNNAGAIQPAPSLNWTGMAPAISGTPAEGWTQYFRSRSEFSSNIVVPGVRNTSNPSNENDPGSSVNFTKKDCETYYTGFRNILCAGIGSLSETASQRAASVFENPAGKDYHILNLPNMGANLETIARAIGSARDLVAEPKGQHDAVIRFFTAASERCALDYTDDPQGDSERIWADFTEGPQSITLSNLRANTRYYVRLQCASEQPVVQFQTLP